MLKHDLFDLEFLGNAAGLWRYQPHDAALAPQTILPPVFEIDSQPITASLSAIATLRPARLLPNGCTEYCFGGPLDAHPDLLLEMIFRVAPADPVLRFRYRLTAQGAHHLTKQSGHDHLRYAGFGLEAGSQAVEVVFSEFQELTHAYSLAERPLAARHFQAGLTVAGPILAAASPGGARLWAYEHGSTLPNTYVHFRLGEDVISLEAARGNYFHNQPLDADHPYETIWLQFAAIPGSLDDLAAAYRRFVLEHLSLSSATRQPHIFYNTWNYQERNFHWNGQPYLASMNAERMLAEIEVAHRMGIDVFVIDTGWYAKTGDWQVDTVRFPHGLGPIKARLDEYGMRLGLWFNPLAAAVSSQVRDEYADCVMSWEGVESPPQPVWETEASQPYCLASRYAEAFAETLIRLNRELGVTYFKWDGIHQGGCSSPRHAHGSESNPEAERAACYEFQMVAALVKIAETVNAACPDAIVDLDLTEGGRCMGLAFLSAGKYFLINNGPYYANYDLPMPGTNENMFFFPGWARAAICRTALAFDKWLPSVLFLTHYLPDDTPGTQPRWCQPEGIADSQEVNLASLILGQNGIWGDLLALSSAGVARFGEVLGHYKRVRQAITQATPVRTGAVGGSPEIYEKLWDGAGVVVIFAMRRGAYTYITHNQTGAAGWHNPGVRLAPAAGGRTRLDVTFERPGAKVVFFNPMDAISANPEVVCRNFLSGRRSTSQRRRT